MKMRRSVRVLGRFTVYSLVNETAKLWMAIACSVGCGEKHCQDALAANLLFNFSWAKIHGSPLADIRVCGGSELIVP